jgi:hypothetical protein
MCLDLDMEPTQVAALPRKTTKEVRVISKRHTKTSESF